MSLDHTVTAVQRRPAAQPARAQSEAPPADGFALLLQAADKPAPEARPERGGRPEPRGGREGAAGADRPARPEARGAERDDVRGPGHEGPGHRPAHRHPAAAQGDAAPAVPAQPGAAPAEAVAAALPAGAPAELPAFPPPAPLVPGADAVPAPPAGAAAPLLADPAAVPAGAVPAGAAVPAGLPASVAPGAVPAGTEPAAAAVPTAVVPATPAAPAGVPGDAAAAPVPAAPDAQGAIALPADAAVATPVPADAAVPADAMGALSRLADLTAAPADVPAATTAPAGLAVDAALAGEEQAAPEQALPGAPATATPFAAPAATTAAGLPNTQRAAALHHAPRAVAQVIQLATRDGIDRARINLRPAELGGIEIRLAHSAAGVAAHVIADSPQAARLLDQAAADLRRALERQDVTLLSLDVSTSSDPRAGGSNGSGFDLGAEHDARRGFSRGGDDAAESEAETTVTATVRLSDGLLVDVLA